MIENIKELFNSYEEHEFIHFGKIVNPPSKRPDICAFLLLDKLIPGDEDIIEGAAHDVIFLNVNLEDLAKVATEEDIIYLSRCGVFASSEYDGLCMFV